LQSAFIACKFFVAADNC